MEITVVRKIACSRANKLINSSRNNNKNNFDQDCIHPYTMTKLGAFKAHKL